MSFRGNNRIPDYALLILYYSCLTAIILLYIAFLIITLLEWAAIHFDATNRGTRI